MMIHQQLLRIQRALTFVFEYLFKERPKGLDFSLRRKSVGLTVAGNNGYARTSTAALKHVLKGIPVSGKNFLDIGSGKGAVVADACELGCERSVGIECETALHRIAQKNFRILAIADKCESRLIDAREFGDFANFEIFFLFNPFSAEIYRDVLNRLIKQWLGGKRQQIYIICYGGSDVTPILESGLFEIFNMGSCPYRGNQFIVFRSKDVLL